MQLQPETSAGPSAWCADFLGLCVPLWRASWNWYGRRRMLDRTFPVVAALPGGMGKKPHHPPIAGTQCRLSLWAPA